MINASTALYKALLKRGSYLERLTIGEMRKLLPILDQAHEEVLGKLAAAGTDYGRQWLADMAEQIKAIYDDMTARISGQLTTDLKPLASDEVQNLESTLGKIAVGVSFTAPSVKSLWASITALPAARGSTLDSLMAGLGESIREDVTSAVQQGMAQGETIDQLILRLRGKTVKRASWRKDENGKKVYHPGTYEGGVMTASTRQAEALARTAVMHVGNQAREAFYSENSDIIKGYQRVETLDSRTCIVCGAMDGKVYGPDEPRPDLPAHVDCRGLYVPVLKSFRELGYDIDELPASTRASMDGQVADFETYQTWMGKQSEARQNAFMGPGRARLFRQGVKLADMIDKNGGLISLDQMTKKDNAV